MLILLAKIVVERRKTELRWARKKTTTLNVSQQQGLTRCCCRFGASVLLLLATVVASYRHFVILSLLHTSFYNVQTFHFCCCCCYVRACDSHDVHSLCSRQPMAIIHRSQHNRHYVLRNGQRLNSRPKDEATTLISWNRFNFQLTRFSPIVEHRMLAWR